MKSALLFALLSYRGFELEKDSSLKTDVEFMSVQIPQDLKLEYQAGRWAGCIETRGISDLKVIYLSVIFLFALTLSAEKLPERPKPKLDRIDWALLASDAGARALDTYSTRRSLNDHNNEMFLPGFIANHTPALAAFEGGMVGLTYFTARNLTRRHHQKWAKLVIAADTAQVLPWAIRNLTMPRWRP